MLHVYNDNFLGIRSASAATPGRKLSLPNHDWQFALHLPRVLEIVQACRPRHLVFHGMSNAIFESVQAIHRHGLVDHIYGVWHGGPAQWVDERETFQLERFLLLDGSGITTRSHFLRSGTDRLLRRPAGVELLNFPPRFIADKKASRPRTAFVPATPSIYKNLYGNILAAELSERVDVYGHYADLSASPLPLVKARRVTYDGALANQSRLQEAAVILNAGLLEAHSMVDLEALSAGRISIHGCNPKETFTSHEYLELSTVKDPGSVDEVIEAIDRLARRQADAIEGICADFSRELVVEASRRWEAFLDC